jgi:hypothetical protein
MVETTADKDQRVLDWMEVNVSAYRDANKPVAEVSLYDAVRILFQKWGVSDDDARFLVKTWKQRWPIRGAVAVATADSTVNFIVHAVAQAKWIALHCMVCEMVGRKRCNATLSRCVYSFSLIANIAFKNPDEIMISDFQWTHAGVFGSVLLVSYSKSSEATAEICRIADWRSMINLGKTRYAGERMVLTENQQN